MWSKTDDKLHDHRKVHDLLEAEEGDALALWVLAQSWCGDQLSDGVVTGYVCARWFPFDWLGRAEALIRVGLWERVESDDGKPRFRFHDWTAYNDSRAKVLADREAARVRKELYGDPELIQAINARDQNRCRYCGARVRWTDKRSGAGGTYDHVVPIADGGRNTLGNVVTACRRCNSAKGKRSLEAAGMRLLRPGLAGAPVIDADEHTTGPTDPAHPGRPEPETGGSPLGSGRVGSGPSPEQVPEPEPNQDDQEVS